MQNFPQSFEPVSSDSILEEFLQLKRNVNEVNDGMVQVETDLANEVNDRQLADQNLQSQIDEIAGHQGTSVKVAGVVQEEVSFVSDPQTQINSKQNTIADIETIRTGASLGSTAVQPSQLASAINGEASTRQLADQNLQSQIDEIIGSSGTTVKVAGVAQTEVSFTSDPQSQINGKQGTISDLGTIRNGASLGATAVQPSQLASAINGEASTRQLADQNLQSQIDEIIGSSGTTVKVDGTSITSNNEADILTINGNYNSLTNKMATMSDLPNITDKANTNLSNVTYPILTNGSETTGNGDRVIKRYVSGTSWYEIYASGWKRCGFRVSYTGWTEPVFPNGFEFSNTNYSVYATPIGIAYDGNCLAVKCRYLRTNTLQSCMVYTSASVTGFAGEAYNIICEGY